MLRVSHLPSEVLCEAVTAYRCGLADLSSKLDFSRALFLRGSLSHLI
jgi:hypothetical protein